VAIDIQTTIGCTSVAMNTGGGQSISAVKFKGPGLNDSGCDPENTKGTMGARAHISLVFMAFTSQQVLLADIEMTYHRSSPIIINRRAE